MVGRGVGVELFLLCAFDCVSLTLQHNYFEEGKLNTVVLAFLFGIASTSMHLYSLTVSSCAHVPIPTAFFVTFLHSTSVP